jgi:hypothetical protein
MPKSIQDQIKDLENTRAAKVARNQKLMSKAAEEGRSMDETEQTEFDGLSDEIDQLDDELVRARRLEKHLGTARPVQKSAAASPAVAAAARDTHIEMPERKQEPGIGFARVVRCLGATRGNVVQAENMAKAWYGENDSSVAYFKAASAATAGMAPGSSYASNWAEKLVGLETSAFADFVEWLRPQTILGKFGMNGIPSLHRVPFRVPLIEQTSGGEAWWVGQGLAKGVTNLGFNRSVLNPMKAANIIVLTKELVRDSSPSADPIIRNEMAKALRELFDVTFIDPNNSGGTVKPASITDSIVPVHSSGVEAANVRDDVKQLFGTFITANNPTDQGVWIMNGTTALSLSLMTTAMGTPEFPGITANGGTFFGLPVITSEHLPVATDGAYVVLVNASDVYFADEGDITVDFSDQASLQMLHEGPSLPTDAIPAGAQSLVSLWQNNLVGYLAERTVNWKRRRSSAVAMLDQVNWGALSS